MKRFIILLLLLFSNMLANQCSSYIGKATINEVYELGNISFVEVRLLDPSLNYEQWSISLAYRQGNNNRINDYSLSGLSLSSSNHIVINTDKNHLNLRAMDIVLYDGNNNVIDYLSIGNYTYQELSCDFWYDTTVSTSSQYKGVLRSPDGTGDWEHIGSPGAVGDPTKGTTNDGLPHIPIVHWGMDECVLIGVNEEVKDMIGSNHGRVYGDNSDNRVTEVTDGIVCRGQLYRGEGYNADPNNAWYQARYFTKVDDNEMLSPLANEKSMTITGWFKTTEDGTILAKAGSDREYRVYVEGGALKFSLYNRWNNSQDFTIKSGITDGSWHFFAIVVDVSSFLIFDIVYDFNFYVDGVLQGSHSGLSWSYRAKDANLYIGAMDWGNNITNFFDGSIDEVSIYENSLEYGDVANLYYYQLYGLDFDGSVKDCSCPDTPIEPIDNCSIIFNTPEGIPKGLKTVIVNKSFEVSVEADSECDESEVASFDNLKVFSDKDCTQPFTHYTSNQDSLTISQASKSLYLQADVTYADGSVEEVCSEDSFAIRPDRFEIENSTLYAGEYLIITAFDGDDNPTQGFNYIYDKDNILDYTLGSCVEIFPNEISFVDGRVEIKIDEVIRDLNITVREEEGSEFASIDAPYSDRFIDEDSTMITVKPHNFVVSNIDFEPSDNWLYMSDLDAMSVDVNVTITARNESNATTTNFDANCYSEGIDTIVKYGYDGDDSVELMSRVDGDDTVTLDANKFEIEMIVDFFEGGSGSKAHKVAVDKDYANAKNPFLIWLDDIDFDEVVETKAKAYYSAVVNTQVSNEHNATFYYARVRPVDLTTSKKEDNTTVYIDVYSNDGSLVDGMERVSLNWYRFDKDSASEIEKVDFNGNNLHNNISFSDAKATVQLNQSAINADNAIISLDVPSYLWHGNKLYDYDGDCSEHPCIYYRYLGGNGNSTSGVQSGEFKGSDVKIDDSNATQPKGIRIFR